MNFTLIGAVTALLAVAAGAFGAHALRDVLSESQRTTFETAARYQLIHAVALVAIAGPARRSTRYRAAAAVMMVGIVLFSGSLYLLTLSPWPAVALLTPVGGVALILGWALVARAAATTPET